MKTRIYILLLMAALGGGCNDFLEEKSQSEIHPNTVKDMEKLLEGEAYFSESEGLLFNQGTDIFTDDWQCNIVTDFMLVDQKAKDRYRFAWDPLMFEEEGGGEDIQFYSVPYSRIKGCNVVLEYMDDMVGDDELRMHVLGEAYLLRGYYYFYLTNFFALPYNTGDPEKNLAVPLKLTTGVTDERIKRSSVADCYAQIEKDMLLGVDLMHKGQAKASALKNRLNYIAGYGFLSRLYLYLENWDKTIIYADSVLRINAALTDMSEPSALGVYDNQSSKEILWGGIYKHYDYATAKKYPFSTSNDLVDLYYQDVDDDVIDIRGDYKQNRKTTYLVYGKEPVYIDGEFDHYENFVSFVNKSTYSITPMTGGIRTAEVYLNRAEAYIRRALDSGNKEDAQKGLDDLNVLRESRFENGYVWKELTDFSSIEELLAFCLRERRRELCGEGNHRWFDLRRTGMPEIKHIYIDQEGLESVYILLPKDVRYVLPFPGKVVERNPQLR